MLKDTYRIDWMLLSHAQEAEILKKFDELNIKPNYDVENELIDPNLRKEPEILTQTTNLQEAGEFKMPPLYSILLKQLHQRQKKSI